MRIAVVGSGIAGLGAAYVLSQAHEVELFERERAAGGHARTVIFSDKGRSLALDTGFIVHNDRTYPLLVRLFRELGVSTQSSEMSFSVSCERCGLEYAGRRPFAQARNAVSPRFLRLLAEIVRFLRTAEAAVASERYAEATLEELIVGERYSADFRVHFLVPLTAAIWSTAQAGALAFPAAYAVRFYANHGMLGFRRFQWKTVVGGSGAYVDALLRSRPIGLRLGAPVRSLRRLEDAVVVRTDGGEERRYDGVVVATHPDQALALLEDASEHERQLLGAFRYSRNETVLHTDPRLLPRARAARASWNYQLRDCKAASERPTVTYSLNRLQALDEDRDYCVTLNRGAEIAEEHVIERLDVEHPVYTLASLRAQERLPELNGQRRTAFCGAYHGYGFHEDGLASGVRAAAAFGVPW